MAFCGVSGYPDGVPVFLGRAGNKKAAGDQPQRRRASEQETKMSKGTRTALAVLTLAVLAACAPRHQYEEIVVVEPAPQPIYVEPVSDKYH
jgi:hypothetical protein